MLIESECIECVFGRVPGTHASGHHSFVAGRSSGGQRGWGAMDEGALELGPLGKR